jgi:4'-phosphopantetheinyl transferase
MQAASFIQNWEKAPAGVSLGENEVHIWRTSLLKTAGEYRQLQTFLDGNECARAQSFFSVEQRCQWIAARGMLRLLLGTYLDVHPAQLTFCYNAYGKPDLGEAWQQTDMRFNLSHSDGLALYAFVRKRHIGLDIEHMRASVRYMRLAQQKFAPAEYETLRSLAPAEQQRAFFTCWSRKEAYLKARGEGMTYGLKSFEVSLRPGEPALLLENHREPFECRRWSICDLVPGEDYVGALVVEHKEHTLVPCHYDF